MIFKGEEKGGGRGGEGQRETKVKKKRVIGLIRADFYCKSTISVPK